VGTAKKKAEKTAGGKKTTGGFAFTSKFNVGDRIWVAIQDEKRGTYMDRPWVAEGPFRIDEVRFGWPDDEGTVRYRLANFADGCGGGYTVGEPQAKATEKEAWKEADKRHNARLRARMRR
jgi:hypothetical protein